MSKADFLQAVQKCNAELVKKPHDAKLLRQRGEAKRKLGQHKDAVDDFTVALGFKPDLALAFAGRGNARRALGLLQEALNDYNSAVRLEPHNPMFLVDRAVLRQQLGNMVEALRDVEAALAVRPNYVQALHLRGEVSRKLGQHIEAHQDFDAALRLDPRHVSSLASRGAVKRTLGLHAEALADFDLALSLAPRNPGIFAGRGATRLELRMSEAAKADFEAALALNPGNDFARWGLEAAAEQMTSQGLQLTLTGFVAPGLNTKFCERRRPGFQVNGYPTYWSPDSLYFLYWCQKESRWKAARWVDFEKVRKGSAVGFIAAPVNADIRLADNLSKGWHEFDGTTQAWRGRGASGVSAVAKLETNVQTITLAGFATTKLNARYGERFRPAMLVNGHETYWTADSQYFLYWSAKEDRWKGTLSTDFERVQGGANPGFIGAPLGADVTSAELVKGWHEWNGAQWVFGEKSGVLSIGTLAAVQLAPFVARGSRGTAANDGPSAAPARAAAVAPLAAAAPVTGAAPSRKRRAPGGPAEEQPSKAWAKVPLFAEGADDDWT